MLVNAAASPRVFSGETTSPLQPKEEPVSSKNFAALMRTVTSRVGTRAALTPQETDRMLALVESELADARIDPNTLGMINVDPEVGWGGHDLTPNGVVALEVRAFLWAPGASSKAHDHPPSKPVNLPSFLIAVIAGTLQETVCRLTDAGTAERIACRRVGAGECLRVTGATNYIHIVENVSNGWMRSLHVYVPGIDRTQMRTYALESEFESIASGAGR